MIGLPSIAGRQPNIKHKAELSMKTLNIKERGFTLVEILIVLGVMSVLTSVAIPNVTGMFTRGVEQTYYTDQETIQTAVSAFYYDVHGGDAGNDWNAAGESGHKWPTASGELPDSDYAGGLTTPDDDDGIIWCGLLVNRPGTGSSNVPGEVAPLPDEKGPYLNEFPESAHQLNSATEYSGGSVSGSNTNGTYVWVLTTSSKVTAFQYNGTEWVEAFAPADDDSDDPGPVKPAPVPGPKKKDIPIGPSLSK
jgi:prepilin-type N-terminal cleavage/methylation domain-containing protein